MDDLLLFELVSCASVLKRIFSFPEYLFPPLCILRAAGENRKYATRTIEQRPTLTGDNVRRVWFGLKAYSHSVPLDETKPHG